RTCPACTRSERIEMKGRRKFLMKSLLSVFLGIACLFFVSCSSTTAAKNLLGKQAPAVRFTMLDGSTVSLANLRGRTVVLVFWASWCSRSRRLIEDLNRLAGDIGNNIIFLAVSIDKLEREEKLREFIE